MSFFTLPRFFSRYLLTGAPSSVTLHVTRRCNLACRTCFVPRGVDEPDLRFFRSIARDLPSLWWLDIGGGEPFLRTDLPEICGLFGAAVVAIPTNGQEKDVIVPMVKELAARTRGDLVISLSVDGPEAHHDAIRGRGTWQKAWATFDALRGIRDVALKVNTVLTGENLGTMTEFVTWVRAQGADAHSLVLLRGDPRDSSLQTPSPDDLRQIGPKLLEELRHYRYAQGAVGARLLWEYHRAAWSISIATLEQRRQIVPCLAGRNHLVVWADRTAGSCELLPPVGRPDDPGLSALMKSPEWQKQCEFIRRGGCWCTHNCALLASILFHPPSVTRMIAAAAGPS